MTAPPTMPHALDPRLTTKPNPPSDRPAPPPAQPPAPLAAADPTPLTVPTLEPDQQSHAMNDVAAERESVDVHEGDVHPSVASTTHTSMRHRGPLLRGRLIVCIASEYEGDPTGKHHIMRELARDNSVLWVDYHGSRRPRLRLHDAFRVARVLGRVLRGARTTAPTMAHFTPLVLPGVRGGWARRFNRAIVSAQVRWRLRRMSLPLGQPVQVWSFAPDAGFLRGAFNEEAFVYYCVDEFRFFEGYDADEIMRREAELLQEADVVFASAAELVAAKSPIRPDIRLIRHGVQFDHFARAWRDSRSTPPDIADLALPRFGFFGLISHWVDVELIAETARLRPDYGFVLIGECQTDVAPLRHRPNVRLLGRKPYADLPAYCRSFSAGLLPFRVNDLTRSVNPIKLREYLAAGLNVISTPLPEVEHYRPHVRVVSTAHDFAAACDALANPPTSADRRRTAQCVADESWSTIARRLGDHVMQSLG